MAAAVTLEAISRWDGGGKEACLQAIQPLLADPNDRLSEHVAALVKAVTVLAPEGGKLAVATVGSFIHSLAEGLPSASTSHQAGPSPLVAKLGDLIVDIIWTIDVEMEDTIDKSGIVAARTPLAELTKALVSYGIVQPSICRVRLELPLLVLAGLVNDKLPGKAPRIRTAMFFKQRKFNLLRETNEGYSKLVVEMNSFVGAAHSSETGRPTEPRSTITKRAESAWEKLVGYIGYFDLDPNRVLDIVLDVFSCHIVAHYSFFLELLRCSGWSRSPIAGAQEAPDVSMSAGSPKSIGSTYKDMTFRDIMRKAAEGTGVQDQSSKPPILSEILGFKFAYYQLPDASTADNTLKSLYAMTAILIREGLITLEDIYEHLTPLDEDLETRKEKLLSAARQKLKAPRKLNALATASSLDVPYRSRGSDRNDTRADSTEASTPGEPPNQKVGLLSALLAVGALLPAFSILSKFPWLVQAYPEVADLVLRVTNASIRPLMDSMASSQLAQHASQTSRPIARYSERQTDVLVVKHALVLVAPTPMDTMTRRHVFYYPDWEKAVPRCSTVGDVPVVLQPMLEVCGALLSRDVPLIGRLCRMAQSCVSELEAGRDDPHNQLMYQIWHDLTRIYILPSLSLIPNNPPINLQVWKLMATFEPKVRWACYDEWRRYIANQVPSRPRVELVVQHQETARATKDLLRRLNKDTSNRTFAIPISTLTLSNPLSVLSIAMSQVLSYSNFVDHLPNVLAYLSPMGFDVLTYLILRALSDPTKEKLKDDGVSLELWLQNITSFTGKLLHRHPDMDPQLIFQHIVHQLHNSSSKEVLLLREIVRHMTWIESLEDMNEHQVLSFAGGPVLITESISTSTRGSRGGNIAKDAAEGQKRLIRTLMSGRRLALPLLIAIAQYRGTCSYRAGDNEYHPKYLGSVFDEGHAAFLQYVDLLTATLPVDRYSALLPSLAELCRDYGLEPALAFHIVRPVYAAKVYEYFDTLLRNKQEAEAKERARQAARAKLDASQAANPQPNGESSDNVAVTSSAQPIGTEAPVSPLAPLLGDLQHILPERTLNALGTHFYVTFWQMSLADIWHPTEQYEIARLNAMKVLESKEPDDRRFHGAIKEMLPKLETERVQSLNVSAVSIRRLYLEQVGWFKDVASPTFQAGTLVSELIHHCLLPRMLLSLADAEYCARMVHKLHTCGTPGLSIAFLYDKLFNDQLSPLLFSCSEREIACLARFLKFMLERLDVWYNSPAQYRKDNRLDTPAPVPGFLKSIKQMQPPVTADRILTHVEFMTFVRKIHKGTLRAIARSLSSNEFRPVTNAIAVLLAIKSYFPSARVFPSAPYIELAVLPYVSDTRGDIQTKASTYHGQLKASMEQNKPDVDVKLEQPQPANPTPPASATHSTPSASTNGLPPRPQSGLQTSIPGRPNANTNGTGALPVNPTGHATPPPTAAPAASRPTNDIPRPAFVKRVQTESRPSSPRPPQLSSQPSSQPNASMDVSASDTNGVGDSDKTVTNVKHPIPLPERPRLTYEENARSEQTVDPTNEMPPPAAPSSKPVAQELRTSARATTTREDGEDRAGPRARKRSATPPRPGTRNQSADSRTSANDGHSRSDRSAGRERDERQSRRNQDDPERERNGASESRRENRTRARDEEDRDKRGERDKDRDYDREREREKSTRDRRHRERESTSRRDRDRDGQQGRASRREEARFGRNRDDGGRNRDYDDGSHKRRREDEPDTPTKRARETDVPDAQDDRYEGPKDEGRPPRRTSPAPKERFRSDGDREPPRRPRADASGRSDLRSSARDEPRSGRDREDDRNADRRASGRTERRDTARESDRENASRPERKDRDILVERAAEARIRTEEVKAQARQGEGSVPSQPSNVPSGPRSMSIMGRADAARGGGMRSDHMNNGMQGPRGRGSGGGSSLLNRLGPGSGSNPRDNRNDVPSGPRADTEQQEGPIGVPSKRSPPPSEPANRQQKRIKINRNFQR